MLTRQAHGIMNTMKRLPKTAARLARGWSAHVTPARMRLSRWTTHHLTGVRQGHLLFIACFPKSGSTYLATLLRSLTDYPQLDLAQHRADSEEEICRFRANKCQYRDGVIQQHAQAKRANLQALQSLRVKPVILTRNLYDVVLSLDDHFHNETSLFPTGDVPHDFFRATELHRWHFIINCHLPWYFNFLMSWQDAAREIETYWLTYERLFTDQEGAIAELCDFWGLRCPPTRTVRSILEKMARQPTRLNVGTPNRGRLLLREHRQAIEAIASSAHAVGLSTAALNKVGIQLSSPLTPSLRC
jgi:hypothetical protein